MERNDLGGGSGNTKPGRREGFWKLRLYVAGQSMKTIAAVQNLESICEEYLPNRHNIEVVDLLEEPERAEEDQILAIPTLVRRSPIPVRKIIGDLSNTDRVLVALDLPRHAAKA